MFAEVRAASVSRLGYTSPPPLSSTIFALEDLTISRQALTSIMSRLLPCSLERKANAESVAIIYERVLTRIFWTPQSANIYFLFFLYVVSARIIRKKRAFLRRTMNLEKWNSGSRRNFLEKVNLDVDLYSRYVRNTRLIWLAWICASYTITMYYFISLHYLAFHLILCDKKSDPGILDPLLR